MLEYCKKILEKVSFDKALFEKELKKSKKWLSKNEIKALKQWVSENFGMKFPDITSRHRRLT
ncbi:hypothetical protein RCC89_07260 [Cytophagaceae bacterium ABcell3]|nr:hypothetical protein RCC89_07260 [Cytophagaceae bacterium ABcell3]